MSATLPEDELKAEVQAAWTDWEVPAAEDLQILARKWSEPVWRTFDEELTEPVQRALQTFVNGLLGRELRVDYAWAGIFGMVMDFLPVVGPVPDMDNVWVAGGYSGHGNVLGLACGELVAQAVCGEAVAFLDVLDPARLLNADA